MFSSYQRKYLIYFKTVLIQTIYSFENRLVYNVHGTDIPAFYQAYLCTVIIYFTLNFYFFFLKTVLTKCCEVQIDVYLDTYLINIEIKLKSIISENIICS